MRPDPPRQLRLADHRDAGHRGSGDERVVRAAARTGHDQARPGRQLLPHTGDRALGQVRQRRRIRIGDSHPRAQLDQRRGGGKPGDAGPGDEDRRAGELGEPHDAMPDEAVSHSL